MAEKHQPVKLPLGFENDLALACLRSQDLSGITAKNCLLLYVRTVKELRAAADELAKTGLIIK